MALNSPIYVLDGGFSSQISRYDQSFNDHPLWSSWYLYKNPELVFKTHVDYLKAGADIITTNTYQASVPGFQKYLDEKLSEQECLQLIEKAVEIAKQARDFYDKHQKENNLEPKKILIAGSVGPYGISLHDGSEYSGSYINHISIQEMKNWHRPRIEALIRAGVDLIALETLPASKEAEMLVNLLKDFPKTKAWLSFSCQDEKHTNFGENYQEVAQKCYNSNSDQLIAVGVNCTKPEYIEPLIKGINDDHKNKIPIIVYPNSGETYDNGKGWINIEKCKPVESYVSTWIDLGVKYIGGCCRTYDKNITNIRQEVDKLLNTT